MTATTESFHNLDTRAWEGRVRAYFTSQDLRQTTPEEFETIPPRVRVCPSNRRSRNAPCGQAPPLLQDAIRYNDALAQYFDQYLMTRYDVEVRACALLAAMIDAHAPRLVLDAGCGTGITLGFLAREFPDIEFWAYDCSAQMLAHTRTRIQRLGLQNVTRRMRAHHGEVGCRFPPRSVDFFISKCSLGNGVIRIPDFAQATSEQLARQIFLESDPFTAAFRRLLTAFATILQPDGVLVEIGQGYGELWWVIECCADEMGLERIRVDTLEDPPPMEDSPPVRETPGEVAAMSLAERRAWAARYGMDLDDIRFDQNGRRIPGRAARKLIQSLRDAMTRQHRDHWARFACSVRATSYRRIP